MRTKLKELKQKLDEKNKICARLTTGKEQKLTLRLYLTSEQKERLLIQKGKQPKELFSIVVI